MRKIMEFECRSVSNDRIVFRGFESGTVEVNLEQGSKSTFVHLSIDDVAELAAGLAGYVAGVRTVEGKE